MRKMLNETTNAIRFTSSPPSRSYAQKHLNDLQIADATSYVQWRVGRLSVWLGDGAVLQQQFHQLDVARATGAVEEVQSITAIRTGVQNCFGVRAQVRETLGRLLHIAIEARVEQL